MTECTWRASCETGKECCKFEHNGNTYLAHRMVSGEITSLMKRTHRNSISTTFAGGVDYQPLKLTGQAARKVLKALSERSK